MQTWLSEAGLAQWLVAGWAQTRPAVWAVPNNTFLNSFSLADILVELPLWLFAPFFFFHISRHLFSKSARNLASFGGQQLKKFLGLNRKDK